MPSNTKRAPKLTHNPQVRTPSFNQCMGQTACHPLTRSGVTPPPWSQTVCRSSPRTDRQQSRSHRAHHRCMRYVDFVDSPHPSRLLPRSPFLTGAATAQVMAAVSYGASPSPKSLPQCILVILTLLLLFIYLFICQPKGMSTPLQLTDRSGTTALPMRPPPIYKVSQPGRFALPFRLLPRSPFLTGAATT